MKHVFSISSPQLDISVCALRQVYILRFRWPHHRPENHISSGRCSPGDFVRIGTRCRYPYASQRCTPTCNLLSCFPASSPSTAPASTNLGNPPPTRPLSSPPAPQAAIMEQDKNWIPLHPTLLLREPDDGTQHTGHEERWEEGFVFERFACPHQVVGCTMDGGCRVLSTEPVPGLEVP